MSKEVYVNMYPPEVRYSVLAVDSEDSPAWFDACADYRPVSQDSGRVRYEVTTCFPGELEDALDLDDDVIEYSVLPDAR